MTLKLVSYAVIILAALGAIWYFFIIPAEKRDHQRRIELVKRKLERHEASKQSGNSELEQ